MELAIANHTLMHKHITYFTD